jgi:hypothetical protein
MMTGDTLPSPQFDQDIGAGVPASGALVPTWPSASGQIPITSVVGGEPQLEFTQSGWERHVGHAPILYVVARLNNRISKSKLSHSRARLWSAQACLRLVLSAACCRQIAKLQATADRPSKMKVRSLPAPAGRWHWSEVRLLTGRQAGLSIVYCEAGRDCHLPLTDPVPDVDFQHILTGTQTFERKSLDQNQSLAGIELG